MNEALFILILGTLIVMSVFASSCLKRAGIPSLVGFILLGVAIRVVGDPAGFLSTRSEEIFKLLGRLGVICLLFRVGLESDIKSLLRQLRHASVIWACDVAVSGFVGFAASHWLLGMHFVPSLFIGAAMTATSVGVSVDTWRGAGALESRRGKLLIDVAEMDDISGVVVMALLFSIAPLLKTGGESFLLGRVAKTLGFTIVKLFGFGAFCFIFSRFLEQRFTGFIRKMEHRPGPMISIAGTAIIMAALAGLLGFSVAVGAFFAGLVFSRDPKAVKMDTAFDSVYALFVPFFFIHIGLSMKPGVFLDALWIGLFLVLFAAAGKLVGAGGGTRLFTGWRGTLLVGMSMIPRAEIAMIIVQKDLSLGDWAMPHELFGGMIVVSMLSCLGVPVLLRRMLLRWKDSL